jgi:amidohydrolase
LRYPPAAKQEVRLVLPQDLAQLIAVHEDDLIAVRRDLHAHPELAWAELRTTNLLRHRLEAAGLAPHVLPRGTGLLCDVGSGPFAVALRGDIDALPVQDLKAVPYRSTHDGACHACGHDIHTTVVLGAALVLAELERAGRLPGRVRLIFQPAEEIIPGGAHEVMDAGGLDGVRRIFALHCDPRVPLGHIGTRVGAITAACDLLVVRLTGPGGHTARPHLTADLVYALGKVVTELPAALSRRVDPRAGLSLVWGHVRAGVAPNAIPQTGEAEGTLRCLDSQTWQDSPELLKDLVEEIIGPYGVHATVEQRRGVPPVHCDPVSVRILQEAVTEVSGADTLVAADQSMGGEDFGWYVEEVPGAFVRLGVGCPDDAGARDLHQGNFDVDERCIALGVSTLVAAALAALEAEAA